MSRPARRSLLFGLNQAGKNAVRGSDGHRVRYDYGHQGHQKPILRNMLTLVELNPGHENHHEGEKMSPSEVASAKSWTVVHISAKPPESVGSIKLKFPRRSTPLRMSCGKSEPRVPMTGRKSCFEDMARFRRIGRRPCGPHPAFRLMSTSYSRSRA